MIDFIQNFFFSVELARQSSRSIKLVFFEKNSICLENYGLLYKFRQLVKAKKLLAQLQSICVIGFFSVNFDIPQTVKRILTRNSLTLKRLGFLEVVLSGGVNLTPPSEILNHKCYDLETFQVCYSNYQAFENIKMVTMAISILMTSSFI